MSEPARDTGASRPFIAAMQVTLDGYSLAPDGTSDWVDSWADSLELVPSTDLFVLGGGMFPGYEVFWTAVREDPQAVAEWVGRDPYPREIAYAGVAAETPHVVLSNTLDKVTWPTARIVREVDELRALKTQPGGAVYVVGGAGLVRTVINEGLLDELRLIVHPIVLGAGASLLDGIAQRQNLELIESEHDAGGRVRLSYRVATENIDNAR